jgi:hypothetical protein
MWRVAVSFSGFGSWSRSRKPPTARVPRPRPDRTLLSAGYSPPAHVRLHRLPAPPLPYHSTAPDQRRRGIARGLLDRQHAWCRSQGCRRMRTDTTNAFREMLLVNLRASFDVIGTFHDAERGLTIMLERAL